MLQKLLFGVGQQLFDAGNNASQVLQVGRDDELGGFSVGDLSQCLQAAQSCLLYTSCWT